MTRRKKIVLIILSVVAVILTVFGVKMYLFFTAKPNIAVNYVAEWNKISKPDNYDPNQNAYFDYAKAVTNAFEIPEGFINAGFALYWTEWPADFNESELAFLKNWVDKNKNVFDFLKAGSDKPYYWSPAFDGTPLWEARNSQPLRMKYPISLLCWRASLNAFENRIDDALDDILTCYKIGCQMNTSKNLLVEQYLGSEFHSNALKTFLTILNNTQVDPNKLINFNNLTKREFAKITKNFNFESEKFFAYDVIQKIYTDDGNKNGHLIPENSKFISAKFQRFVSGGITVRYKLNQFGIFRFLRDVFTQTKLIGDNPNFYILSINGPDREKTVQDLEKIYQYYGELQNKTLWELHNDNIDLRQVETLSDNFWAIKLSDPFRWSWPPSPIQAFQEYKCEREALVTILAIMLFKSQNGLFPNSLQELIDAGFLSQLPQDPYNEGALIYKKDSDNFKLYSLGQNFTDNGGVIFRDDNREILWWDFRNKSDVVFWPYPKANRQRRLER